MTSEARTCAACSSPVHDADTICRQCVRHTRRHLANQAAYLADLETELARQVRKQPANDGGKSAETPLPYSPPAGDLIAEQKNLLVSWVKLCIDQDLLRHHPADNVPALAMALDTRMPELRKHEAAGEFVAEIRALVERILRVIDLPEYRMRQHAGPCFMTYPDEQGHDEHCPGQVEMVVPHDERIESWLECLVCKMRWKPDQFTRAGLRIKQREAEIEKQRKLAEAMGRIAS